LPFPVSSSASLWPPVEPANPYGFANAGGQAMPKQPVTLVAGLVLMAIAIALMLATLPP
jgi:hypothetical protein